MAISIPTLDTIESQVLAYFRTEFGTRDLGPQSWLGKQARAIAITLLGLYKSIYNADIDAYPNTETSSDRLDEFANLFGLSNGAGGYGRKGAEAATGGLGLASFTSGPNTVTAGEELASSDGQTDFEVRANVAYAGPGAGTAEVTIDAVTTGTAGNLAVGAVLNWSSPPAFITGTVTLTTALSGGLDEETDGDLLTRILERLQNPPKGGTGTDYRTWAEGVSGINRAYVYPRRSGTGTVDIVVTASGSGTTRAPAAATITSVQTEIDAERPVCVESATVYAPAMPTGYKIHARVTPSKSKYNFDWNDTAAAYPTVKAGGTTTLLYVNGSMPTAFTNAWNAAAVGSKPRIQIANTTTGAPAKAESRRVTAIDTVTINPDTILTLDSALTVYPTATNTIYSGGPVVAQCQTDILSLVDALGPSRSSGYAFSDDLWDDTLRIDQIIRTVLNAEDTDGTLLCKDLVTDPTIDGAATNQTASDPLTTAPRLLYASLITVVQ